jgi:hypothetical protein
MVNVRTLLVFPLIAWTVASGIARANPQHVLTPSDVTAAVAEHIAAQDTDRAAIREALTRPDVRSMSKTVGVDAERLSSVVDTLSGTDLQRAAAAAREVNTQLVGGASTVTISTTTIIIALLLVILLVVALK